MDELRKKMDVVPEEQRQTLLEFADKIGRDHARMQNCCNDFADMVDDLDLAVKAMKFNLWASQRDARRIRGAAG
jgi:hypothetical protein